MKIMDHPKRTTEMLSDDVFLIDGDSGTQILPLKNLVMSDSEIDASIRKADEGEKS